MRSVKVRHRYDILSDILSDVVVRSRRSERFGVTPPCHDDITMQAVPNPHPPPTDTPVSAIDFAVTARALADQCRAIGLAPPDFRSPPKVLGLTRTLRRRPDGSVTVAVAFKNRPQLAILADMIDGAIAANELTGVAAARARDELWLAVPNERAQAA